MGTSHRMHVWTVRLTAPRTASRGGRFMRSSSPKSLLQQNGCASKVGDGRICTFTTRSLTVRVANQAEHRGALVLGPSASAQVALGDTRTSLTRSRASLP